MSTAPVVVQSAIVRTTVFSESAHVSRRARADLSAGLHRLALADLPDRLEPSQLRVETSHGQVRFVETDDLELADDETEATADQARVVEAEKKVHRGQGELAALQAELQLIDRVVPGRGVEGPSPAPLRPEQFLQGLEVLTKRRRETMYAIRVAQYELHLARQALIEARALVEGLGRTEGPNGRPTTLVVGLDLEDAQDVELTVTYTSGWATWRPYYTLRLGANAEHVEVSRFADVWQQTAEDWPDVALHLSTAEPEEGLVLPEAPAWILERRHGFEDGARDLYKRRKTDASFGARAKEASRAPMAPPAAMPSPSRAAAMDDLETGDLDVEHVLASRGGGDAMEVYAEQYEEEGIFSEITSAGLSASRRATLQAVGGITSWAGAPPEAPPPPPAYGGSSGRGGPPRDHPDFSRLAEQAAPRASSGGIDFEIEIAGKSTCKSGRQRQRIGLGSHRYPSSVQYLLRPGIKDHAFGRVTVTNQEAVPLLAGPAAIFVEDAYFGTTQLATTPADGKMVLDLGAETAIKSARRSRTRVRTEGLISKEDVHAVEVIIEIESFMDRPVQIEVQDQVPVSTDAKVKVKLLEASPKPDHDLETGILTFHAEIAPRSRLQIKVQYEIEAPKDYQLVQTLTETT